MKLTPSLLKIWFFTIWSFGPFLVAVKNIRFRNYHSIILLFAFIYGYSVYLEPGGDVMRYMESFLRISRADWKDYWILLQNSYSGRAHSMGDYGVVSIQPDIYALSLQFLVSRITENFRWFFAAASLIYTYFLLKFVNEVVPEILWVNSVVQKIFFSYLLLVVPFHYCLAGIRFWTALFFFMFFSIRHIKHSNVKYIFGAAASILIHFAFYLPVFLLLVYRIALMRRILTFFVLLVSVVFFIATSNDQILNYIQKAKPLLSDTRIAERAENYSDQGVLETYSELLASRNWYVNVKEKSLIYVLAIFVMLEQFRLFRYKDNNFTKKLYPFYIIFFITTMFTFNLGAINRFQYIFYLVALMRYSILAGLNPGDKRLKLISAVMFPALVLHILITFRGGFYTVDPLLLVGNPLILFIYQSKISLSELLIGH